MTSDFGYGSTGTGPYCSDNWVELDWTFGDLELDLHVQTHRQRTPLPPTIFHEDSSDEDTNPPRVLLENLYGRSALAPSTSSIWDEVELFERTTQNNTPCNAATLDGVSQRDDSGAEDDSNSSDGGENENDMSNDESSRGSHSPISNERSSDTSSDSSLVSPVLDIRRRQVINRLMSEFSDLLDQAIGFRRRPSGSNDWSGGAHRACRSGRQNAHGQGSQGNRRQVRGGSAAGNSRGSGDGRGNGAEDAGAGGPSEAPQASNLKFACPYFQRDPRKHRKHRSCAGPGWTTVHRVKEHVYRQHKLPVFCTRCGTTFPQDAQLVAHSRLAQACDVSVFVTPDGFTEDQERSLRRKRKLAGSEESKWVAMYKILFPDDAEGDVPSPYYESTEGVTWEIQRAREFDSFERYLRRELPRVVRQRLEVAASEYAGPLESHLRAQLVEIVRDAQSGLFQLYRSTGTGPEPAVPATLHVPMLRRTPFDPDVAGQQNLHSTTSGDDLHDAGADNGGIGADSIAFFDFPAFYTPPAVDENYANPSTLTAAAGGDRQALSDSGYASYGVDFDGFGSLENWDCTEPVIGDPETSLLY